MIVILRLNTGAYCSSTRLDITIANRLSPTLHSFSHCSIHPFNVALSSLLLLFSSLCSSFPGPPQASYPSSPPTLLMGSHSIPFANNGKCLSLKQTLSTTVMNSWSAYRKGGWNCTWPLRVPSWRDSVFFSAEEKVECLILSLSIFHWIFSKQLDVLYTSFWSKTL